MHNEHKTSPLYTKNQVTLQNITLEENKLFCEKNLSY